MKADVYKAGQLAAEIHRVNGGTEFRYLPGYLATDGPAVATSLPKTEQPLWHGSGAVPPFFAGLLPEGRRLSVLRAEIKASADDELTLLLAVGQDTVGDVQVVAHGAKPGTATAAIEVPFADIMRLSITEELQKSGLDRVAIPGVQDKLSGKVINLPGRHDSQDVIIKLDPPEYPHVTRNEAVFLGLAKQAGLNAPVFELARDRDGLSVLLISRFDRLSGRQLAMEDASQVMGIWPADKYNMSYEQAVDALARQCAAQPVARLELYRQIVFAWLTGNGDLHAKNLSILADARTGEWRISPAYDLPSTVPYRDTTLALTLAGGREGVSRRKLLAFAEEIRVPARAAERALDQLLARTAIALSDVAAFGLPYDQKTTVDWQNQLDYRRRLLSRTNY